MNLTIIISVLIICITISVLSYTIIMPYLKEKNNIEDKKTKNELYRLYSELDPDIIKTNIDNLIENAIAEYMFINIRTRESVYMNNKDIDDMIKNVSASVYLNLSDMYITFIKMIYSISSDDDLAVYINNAVKIAAVPIIKDNNKLI